MDLTPRLLTEVEFREQWRGYSPNDVDDFLERAAVAVGELQERLREATERAAQAERRLIERTDDDEIRRALVLAQRTALTTVEEAQAEADRIIGDARRAVADAEARLAGVEADVETLATFAETHRAAMRAELSRLVAELDAPNPALVQPELPASTDRSDRHDDDADESDALELPVDVGEPTGSFDVLAEEDGGSGGELCWSGEVALGEVETEPPLEHDDDPFLTELRRAVTDTEPLGPRDDDGFRVVAAAADDAVPPGRFRLRRGR